MGDPRGFLKVKREKSEYRPVCERIKDYKDVVIPRSDAASREQSSRCMNCGIPFCQWGCPVGNYIPEWNDLVFSGQWKMAFELLNATNNLPEITGRICPAPCEFSCVLGINDDPVTIEKNELAIIEHAYKNGYIKTSRPKIKTGKKVAVVGSGPAGLSCAMQLNTAGHHVEIFERDNAIGGIMRYGIPQFKLEKWVLDRRIKLMKKNGIVFHTSAGVGDTIPVEKLLKDYDAVSLAIGSRIPRDLSIEGRDLKGIHFAMDFLIQEDRSARGEKIPEKQRITAKNKKVLIIGGGDTGADCVGTANRQKASCVVQIEVLSRPPACRTDAYPWPQYPLILKTSTSHEEGIERRWAVLTKKFVGTGGVVKEISCVRVDFTTEAPNTCPVMREIPSSSFEIEADLVILAIGFLGPEQKGLVNDLKLTLDQRGNIQTDNKYMTSKQGVFAAGDARRGQSLIVWAIAEGRRSAHAIDVYLMGESDLPDI